MWYLHTSVGIEIRQEDLLISCLQSNFGAAVFTHCKRVRDFRTRDREEVRREIDAFFRTNRLSRETVVLGIPRRDVILRHLDLPVEVEDNLKQVVMYQVQSFEPTEEEKFYHDYVVLKHNGATKRLQVLVLMMRKAVLDEQLGILRELGVRPVMVTTGAAALTSVFLQAARKPDKRTFILLDLTPSGVEVIALRDGSLLYSRESPRAGDASWKNQLLAEIETAAAKIRLGPDDSIERIVLSGEPSEEAQRDLREEIEECDLMGKHVRFEMPVNNRAHVQEAAAALGLAWCGLVRRPAVRLNLLPSELRIRQSRWAYVPSIVLGIVVVLLLSALGFRQIVQERILIRQLDQEIAALRPRVEAVRAVRTQVETLEKQITFIEGLVKQRDMNLEIIQELTTLLPPDTFLSFYTNREGNIQISGSSNSAPDLIPKLERSPILKSVSQRGTVFKDAQSGKDRFNFEAKLER